MIERRVSTSCTSSISTDDQEDVWLKPLDARFKEKHYGLGTLLDVVVVLSGVSVVITGIILLFSGEWEPSFPSPSYPSVLTTFDGASSALPLFAYRYVVASMTLEVACLALTGCGMCCVAATLGRHSLVHALSMFSILNDFCLAIAYTASAIWGNYVLYRLLSMCKFLSWSTPLGGEGTTVTQKALILYAVLTAILGSAYAASRIPIFLGICDFALHQVKHHLLDTPIVQFYDQHRRGYGDEFYVQVMPVQEFANLVSNMPDPIHGGGVPGGDARAMAFGSGAIQ